MDTTAPPRLDRTGRTLVILGGLVIGPLVGLPAAGVVLFLVVTGGCGFADDCQSSFSLVPLAIAAVVPVVALMVAIVGAARGSSVALVLAGLGGLAVAASGLIGLAIALEQGRPEDLALAYLLGLTAGGFALALGAALRLIGRHAPTHHARPGGAGPYGS